MVDLSDPVAVARPVVAIDGPGSSGKTSVGAAVAERLGFRFCDTGLFYRAVTFAARRGGIGETDADRLVDLVGAIRLEADPRGHYAVVTFDEQDVSAEVQAPEIDSAVSAYARVPALRTALLGRQREIAAQGGLVMAGRDIGTVVLPDAEVKIYLDASVEERARRRAEERGIAPNDPGAAEILVSLRSRDEDDSSRDAAPLRRAPDAVVIRTDGISFEATVDQVVAAITARMGRTRTDAPDLKVPPEPGATAAPESPVPGRPAPERTVRARKRPTAPTPIATRITWVIRIASFVMRVIARMFTTVVIEGDIDAIPRRGAVLIAANHASNADPVLIGGFLNSRLGRPINWMGKREVFEWPGISWLARQGGVHPVDRGAADVEAFRTATRILAGGHILAVFPEGTRSPDGQVQAAKDGVAVLAARSGALIVPIGLGDSDHLWPRGHRLPVRTRRVTVRIGEPFHLTAALAEEQPGEDVSSSVASRRRSNAAGTDLIMRRIAALLPVRQRGVYGAIEPD